MRNVRTIMLKIVVIDMTSEEIIKILKRQSNIDENKIGEHYLNGFAYYFDYNDRTDIDTVNAMGKVLRQFVAVNSFVISETQVWVFKKTGDVLATNGAKKAAENLF